MVSHSRQIVHCGFEGCIFSSQRRLLSRHFKKRHPLSVIREKSNIPSVFDYFNQKTSQEMSHSSSEIPQISGQEMSHSSSEIPQISDKAQSPGLSGISLVMEELRKFSAAPKILGVFKYMFADGISFGDGETLPRNFRKLKYSLERHFRTQRHKDNLKALTSEISIVDEAVADKVLKVAYYVINSMTASRNFSKILYLQHSNGTNVGDINHSTGVMRQLRDGFYDEIIARIRKFCLTAPCISLVADKTTLRRRTVDIIGIHAIMPEARPGNLIQTLVIGAPEVKNQDGHSLAKNWMSVVSSIGITRPSMLASICTDGQYLHNSVHAHFLRKLNEQAAEEIAVPTVWDQCHLLELAGKTVQNTGWVIQISRLITQLAKIFKWGKNFLVIEKLAKDTDVPFRCPIGFSETRWSTHAAKAFKCFLINKHLYKHCFDIGIAKGKKDTEGLLDHFQSHSEDVTIRAAALCDVFTALGACSQVLQNVQALPWIKMESFSKLSENLAIMIQALDRMCQRKTQRHKMKDLEIVDFMDLDENRNVHWENLSKFPNISDDQIHSIKSLLLNLQSALSNRVEGQFSNGTSKNSSNSCLFANCSNIKLVADLCATRQYKSLVARARLMDSAFQKLQQDKLVPNSIIVTQDCYIRACQTLKEYKPQTNEVMNQELFKFLWDKSRTDILLKSYIDVVARLWLITPCESIVESMGSILKCVFGVHRNLTHKNAAKELVIKWNGPPLGEVMPLIQAVKRRVDLNFCRKNNRLGNSIGTVLAGFEKCRYPTKPLFMD